jgi:hypothetical protein
MEADGALKRALGRWSIVCLYIGAGALLAWIVGFFPLLFITMFCDAPGSCRNIGYWWDAWLLCGGLAVGCFSVVLWQKVSWWSVVLPSAVSLIVWKNWVFLFGQS